MKQACVVLAVMMLTGWNEAPPTTGGFEEYALQSCLTDCYATFRPDRIVSNYANCVDRCKRIYERSKRRGMPGTRKW